MKKTLLFLAIISLSSCSSLFKENSEILFVQNAEEAIFHNERLTIKDSTKRVTYFSDRPYQITGNISNTELIEMWIGIQGDDSFLKDPPNAVISYYNKNGRPDVVIAELLGVGMKDGYIFYDTKVIHGQFKENMKEVTLFFDGEDTAWKWYSANYDVKSGVEKSVLSKN